MVYLVLDDLRRPARVVLRVIFHLQSLEFHLNRFITFAFARSPEERKTSLFGFIYARLF
jgi:hypothetical protein